MTIIDSHVHFWNYDPIRDAWITEKMAVIKKNFTPEHLQKEFEINQVEGCVAVQADETNYETNFLLSHAKKNPFVKGVVGWIDLTDKSVADLLYDYSKEPLIKGFRNVIQGEPDEKYFQNKEFRVGMKRLQRYGFTYDLLIYHNQLPSAIAFTEKYPDQHFMLDHIAKPDIRNKQWKVWKDDIRELAKNPNIYCKVSGMITEADWKNWKYEDLLPYLEIVAEYFGTDRLCFGSDWPVALVAGKYSEVIQVVRSFLLQVSETEREKVLSVNTKRFYKLN